MSENYWILKEYINKISYSLGWLLQLQIRIFEKYINNMESTKIKRYIFRIFNNKIKYKATWPVQFKKSINKWFDKGKKQLFRKKRNPFWGKDPSVWERGKKGRGVLSRLETFCLHHYYSIQNVKE